MAGPGTLVQCCTNGNQSKPVGESMIMNTEGPIDFMHVDCIIHGLNQRAEYVPECERSSHVPMCDCQGGYVCSKCVNQSNKRAIRYHYESTCPACRLSVKITRGYRHTTDTGHYPGCKLDGHTEFTVEDYRNVGRSNEKIEQVFSDADTA